MFLIAPPEPRTPVARRGLATGETLVLLVAVCVMTTASFVLVPQALQGMSAPTAPADEPPASPALLPSYDAIRILLQSCRSIIAVHADREAGLTELVIWHRDTDLDGQYDPSELAVLTHSRFLGQISASSVAWQPSPDDRDFKRLTSPVAPSVAAASDFPSAWRSREDVTVTPVAVGIDGFRLERLDRKFGEDAWRVVLLWGPDSSDAYEDGMSSFVVIPKRHP